MSEAALGGPGSDANSLGQRGITEDVEKGMDSRSTWR